MLLRPCHRGSRCASSIRSAERELERLALPEYTDGFWHGYIPDVHPGLGVWLPRAWAIRAGSGRIASTQQVAAGSLRRGHIGELKWTPECFGYTLGAEGDDLTFDKRDSAPFVPQVRRGRSRLRLEGPAALARRSVGSDDRLRSARARLHQAASGCAGKAARHVQGARHARGHRLREVPRRDDRRAVADSHCSSTTVTCSSAASRITGATTRIGFFSPDPRYASEPEQTPARVQGDGRALPRGGPRGHSRCGLQPHRRGQRTRADAVLQGHRQLHVLPAAAGPAALLHQRYRHRQHAEPRHTPPSSRW